MTKSACLQNSPNAAGTSFQILEGKVDAKKKLVLGVPSN